MPPASATTDALAALRSGAALLPIPCGEIVCCHGADAISWLQGLVSNDLAELKPNYPVRALLLDATGHARFEACTVLPGPELRAVLDPEPPDTCVVLIVPDGAARPVVNWLDQFLIAEDAVLSVPADKLSVVSIQGPLAEEAAASALSEGEAAQLVTHARCGSGGVDVVTAASAVHPLVARLKAAMPSASLSDWELCRIEAGIPRWPQEFGEAVLAPELGLDDTHISARKGCYIGQEIVARIQARGHTNRKLCRLTVRNAEESLVGQELLQEDKPAVVGRITSFADSRAGGALALGFVRHEHAEPGTRLRTATGVECVLS
ncbi:MAG: hypothetical protein KGJ62_11575 [Armatimonadetes bacterium]|nr:hypothetical protein [Armatimonadota bacterium]MDE2206501.1 hypothetical protein [Armatimonadota bacterium]